MSSVVAVIYNVFGSWGAFLQQFTMNSVAREHSCRYLQGFCINERIFAAIYNDFEHRRAFLLLFTMVYGTRVCFCLFLQCFSHIFSHMMLHVQIA